MASFLSKTMVLIPALNEELSVQETIRDWYDLGAAKVRVIDNGSVDDTKGQSLKAGAEVVTEYCRGYGAAAWRGLQNWPGGFDWVIFSSADGSDRLTIVEARQWQQFVDAGYEFIFGDRTETAATRALLTPAQRFGNWLCCTVIFLAWGRKFKDLGSLRLVRKGALDIIELKDRGFGWNVEMQIRALENKFKIVELPVGYYPRRAGFSKISGNLYGTFTAGVGMLKMLILLFKLRKKRE